MNSVFCDWSYGNTTKWDETWKHCAGLYQSPLNIIDSQAATFTKQVTLCFENFVTPIEADLTNNGKTAKLELPSSANVSVIGNRLYINNHYKLEEVHFHWHIGDAVSGSEHKINGKSASMEVHLVHYNLKYTRFETAKEKYDGVLVLSVLVDVSTNVSQNSFWSAFSDKLAVVRSPGSKTKLRIKFSNFLPRNRDDFYLYKGSLTSPPCFETVTWVVYKERLLIPEEYLQRFWALRTANASGGSQVLASNIRPVKPLNSRIVLKTFQCEYCILLYILKTDRSVNSPGAAGRLPVLTFFSRSPGIKIFSPGCLF
jgi:carbonic anhydrase